MSQTLSPTRQSLRLLHTVEAASKTTHDYKEIVYTVFAFAAALLLIALGLRIMFALLVIDNVFARGLSVMTTPFVAPFAKFFPDTHEMVQISTASAFTAYYLAYWAVSLASRFFRGTPSAVSTQS
ncbi:hypothetical protein BH10PAT3_BH10PAT3_1830 [soil metagenome]